MRLVPGDGDEGTGEAWRTGSGPSGLSTHRPGAGLALPGRKCPRAGLERILWLSGVFGLRKEEYENVRHEEPIPDPRSDIPYRDCLPSLLGLNEDISLREILRPLL